MLLECSLIHHNIKSYVYTGKNPEQKDGYFWHRCLFASEKQTVTVHANTSTHFNLQTFNLVNYLTHIF